MTDALVSLAEIAKAEPETDQIKQLNTEAVGLLEKAKTVIVRGKEDYKEAGAMFAAIKQRRKEVEIERKRRVDPLNQALKLINADFKAIDETLEAAGKPYEAGMLAYKREEDAMRASAEREAQKERLRLENEARAKAQEEMKKLEEAKEAQKEAEKAAQVAVSPIAAYLAEEARLQAEAQAQAARTATENALREAAQAPASVVTLAEPAVKAAGTSYRTAWKFRIVNAALIPREYLIPNEQLLGATARTTKGTSSIPGIEFYAEKSIGGR